MHELHRPTTALAGLLSGGLRVLPLGRSGYEQARAVDLMPSSVAVLSQTLPMLPSLVVLGPVSYYLGV